MKNPFYTLIIVVFDGERTIQKAIDSILYQSYKNYELLIIDGLSSDSTIEIIRGNALKDSRIKFISEKDYGIYDAMNKAIQMAKGEWLYFLGCDDYMYNEYVLERIFIEINAGHYEIVYGNVILMPENKCYGGEFSKDDLLFKNISHQSIFYNAIVFKKVGLYNKKYAIQADWDFNIRCYQSTDIAHHYADLIVAYFEKGGASSKEDIKFRREVIVPLFVEKIKSDPVNFKKILAYDFFWRLMRNTKIRSEKELLSLNQDIVSSKLVSRIIDLQRRIPSKLLRIGIFSKLFMLLSYIQNRVIGFNEKGR